MQKRFQRYLARHSCVENCDLLRCRNVSLGDSLSVDDVALDLGCERCARVYLAFFGQKG